MANSQKESQNIVTELLQGTGKFIGMGFTLALFSILTLILFAIGSVLFRVIWPDADFVVDESVVRLVEVLAWPLVAALAIFFTLTARNLREGAKAVFRRITTFKAGDYEVSFSEAGAKQLKRDFEQSLEEYSVQSSIEYMRAARTHRVRDTLKTTLQEIYRLSRQLKLPDQDGIQEGNIAATVHMQDVVYEESLFQLVDYVPSGLGGGRRFSIRYGAIGISYRSGTDRYWNINDPTNTTERLITDWGMTSEEASHSRQDGFALCLTLTDKDGQMSGLLFLKADKIDSITKASDIAEKKSALDKFLEKIGNDAECDSKRRELANAISAVYEDVAPSGTFIRVYK